MLICHENIFGHRYANNISWAQDLHSERPMYHYVIYHSRISKVILVLVYLFVKFGRIIYVLPRYNYFIWSLFVFQTSCLEHLWYSDNHRWLTAHWSAYQTMKSLTIPESSTSWVKQIHNECKNINPLLFYFRLHPLQQVEYKQMK